ncbi:MAG: response regulator [Candidatus Paceibacterota bacterium]|jgi:DNA-binding response OmpR family regulator
MTKLNKKVLMLVVDDEKMLVEAIKEKLLSEGFGVLVAYDGEEGLSLAKSQHPDLILLDLLMPKMDGMTMLKKLREDTWGRGVPVIILTNLSSADEERNKDITKLEPTYYFIKVDKTMDEIVEKIKERLNLL